jgi:hypothetical protein
LSFGWLFAQPGVNKATRQTRCTKATIWQPCCARDVISQRSISLITNVGTARAIVESIAQRKDINAASLQDFLTTTHQGLDNPKGVPIPNLAKFQVKAIVAYLLSLRK